MVLQTRFEPPDLLVADIGGVLTPRDQLALVTWVRETLQIIRDVRLLVLLHGFAGWQLDSSFTDRRQWLDDDDRVAKLAIVGEPQWRVSMLTYAAQPLRRTPIEFFETETAARRWLGAGAASDRAVGT